MYIVRFLHQTTTATLQRKAAQLLYIVRFLHQTTTILLHLQLSVQLYIVRFLHQTTTDNPDCIIRVWLYIVRFLHQTTTPNGSQPSFFGCISFVSYIKPQLNKSLLPRLWRCISFVSYIKPQPIISNKLYTNILLIFFIIKNGRVGFVSIAKILKKLQLNRFADDFFCDFA